MEDVPLLFRLTHNIHITAPKPKSRELFKNLKYVNMAKPGMKHLLVEKKKKLTLPPNPPPVCFYYHPSRSNFHHISHPWNSQLKLIPVSMTFFFQRNVKLMLFWPDHIWCVRSKLVCNTAWQLLSKSNCMKNADICFYQVFVPGRALEGLSDSVLFHFTHH